MRRFAADAFRAWAALLGGFARAWGALLGNVFRAWAATLGGLGLPRFLSLSLFFLSMALAASDSWPYVLVGIANWALYVYWTAWDDVRRGR